MLYRPWASVTTERTFSMRAGLAASTVTPGRTPPLESRATPAMPLVWANAGVAAPRASRAHTTGDALARVLLAERAHRNTGTFDGRSIVNTVPAPSLLDTKTLPLWRSTIALTMDNPRPLLVAGVVREGSTL